MTSRFRIARITVLGAGLIAIAGIVAASVDRGSYYFRRAADRANWEYPAGDVALVVVATILETALAFAVFGFRGPGRMWMRALAALALLTPWASWVSDFVVHAPGFWLLHLIWVWLLLAVLALAALGSALMHAYWFMRARGPASA